METKKQNRLEESLKVITNLRRELNETLSDPIAVIGMACRFPDNAVTPEKYWENLVNNQSSIKEYPNNRTHPASLLSSNVSLNFQELKNSFYGGYLDEIRLFDPNFFSLSHREAYFMSPEQRMLLEITWEALENSNVIPQELQNSNTGVFIGISPSNYRNLLLHENGYDLIDSYFGTGTLPSATAGRISYTFGCIGPCYNIDTACSSSLIAIHEACCSLRRKECDMAIVGAANLILTPEENITLLKSRMLSPSNLCKTFDNSADGYVRGEGCGIIILKRLSDAELCNDNILASIKSTAINQDGASAGITVPSGIAQEKLIRKALKLGKIYHSDISYIETHGTGTKLGDLVEVNALRNIFSDENNDPNRLVIGSVKTNIGHLEATSGMAGIIKVILSMQNELIPANLNFKVPNTHIPWEQLSFTVPVENFYWPISNNKRLAGVSSFSYCGSNAHVILQENNKKLENNDVASYCYILKISAKTIASLYEFAKKYSDYLKKEVSLPNICYTANTHRTSFSYKLLVVSRYKEEIILKIDKFIAKEIDSCVFTNANNEHPNCNLAFLFSHSENIEILSKTYKKFKIHKPFFTKLKEFAIYIDKKLDLSLFDALDTMSPTNEYVNELISFSMQCALYDFWTKLGIRCSIIVAKGVGLFSAGYASGIFDFETMMNLIIFRYTIQTNHRYLENVADIDSIINQLNPRLSGTSIRIIAPENYSLYNISTWFNLVHMGALPDAIPTLNNGDYKCIDILTASEIHDKDNVCNYQAFLKLLAKLEICSIKIDWNIFYFGMKFNYCKLPNYAFEKILLWPEFSPKAHNPTNFDNEEALHTTKIHPLLGRQLYYSSHSKNELLYQNQISMNEPSYLSEHKLLDTLLLPMSALIELIISGLIIQNNFNIYNRYFICIEQKKVLTACILKKDSSKLVETKIIPDNKAGTYEISSADYNQLNKQHSWEKISTGKYKFEELSFEQKNKDSLTNLMKTHNKDVNLLKFYEILEKHALIYVDSFRCIKKLYKNQEKEESVLAFISLDPKYHGDNTNYYTHPILLDSCFRILTALINNYPYKYVFVPRRIKSLTFYSKFPNDIWCHAKILRKIPTLIPGKDYSASLSVFDSSGRLLLQINRLESVLICKNTFQSFDSEIYPQKEFNWFHEIYWQQQSIKLIKKEKFIEEDIKSKSNISAQNNSDLKMRLFDKCRDASVWIIFASNDLLSRHLINYLTLYKQQCIIVYQSNEYSVSSDRIITLSPPSEIHLDLFSKQLIEYCLDNICILDLWSLTNSTQKSVTTEQIDKILNASVKMIFNFIKKIHHNNSMRIKLYILITKLSCQVNTFYELTNISSSILFGFLNTVGMEYPDVKTMHIDLEDKPEDTSNETIQIISEINNLSDERNIAYRFNLRYVSRLSSIKNEEVSSISYLPSVFRKNYDLFIEKEGGLNNLVFNETDKKSPNKNEVKVRVIATGINFIDLLSVMKELPIKKSWLGGDFSGEIVSVGSKKSSFKVGMSVVGINLGCFSKTITLPEDWLAEKPTNLNYAEAASIPTNFITAYYSLYQIANLKKNQSILIHSIAGGTGLAFFQLAKNIGAKIYGTASVLKHSYLKKLGITNVMNSHDLSYKDRIIELTQGKGVDVLINSLTGDGFIDANLDIISPNGVFIELSKRNIFTHTQIRNIRKDIKYHIIDLLSVCRNNSNQISAILREILQLFHSKLVKLPPITVFPIENTSAAFRYMQNNKHIGKIILLHPILLENYKTINMNDFKVDSYYIITGGLGELGLLLTNWLVKYGVRNIILISRRKPNVNYLNKLYELDKAGVNIITELLDVTSKDNLTRMFEKYKDKNCLIKGIFHLAGTIDDSSIANMTWEKFTKVIYPKVYGTILLHNLTKNLSLDHFVLFSSVSSILANPGQANYVAANQFLDDFAFWRRKQGLPALSINWGAWADIGLAKNNSKLKQNIQKQGICLIDEKIGFQKLEFILTQNFTNIGLMPVDWNSFVETNYNNKIPLFFENLNYNKGLSRPEDVTKRENKLKPLLDRNNINDYVLNIITMISGLPSNTVIDLDNSLSAYGFDSLMYLELRENILNTLKVEISVTELMKATKIAALLSLIKKYLDNHEKLL